MAKTTKSKSAGGLQGMIAGDSAIATVGLKNLGLMYRGYNINELSSQTTFEDVAYNNHLILSYVKSFFFYKT